MSNASIWDTLRLVPKGALPENFVKEREATPQCKSFMHVSPGESIKLSMLISSLDLSRRSVGLGCSPLVVFPLMCTGLCGLTFF